MAKKKQEVDPDKLKVANLLSTVCFFDDVDLEKTGISKLNKRQLLILVNELNKDMIESMSNWEGG